MTTDHNNHDLFALLSLLVSSWIFQSYVTLYVNCFTVDGCQQLPPLLLVVKKQECITVVTPSHLHHTTANYVPMTVDLWDEPSWVAYNNKYYWLRT